MPLPREEGRRAAGTRQTRTKSLEHGLPPRYFQTNLVCSHHCLGRVSHSFHSQQQAHHNAPWSSHTSQTARRPQVYFTKVELTDSLKRPPGAWQSRGVTGDSKPRNKRRRQQQRQQQQLVLDTEPEKRRDETEEQSQQQYALESSLPPSLSAGTTPSTAARSESRSESHFQSAGKRRVEADVSLPESSPDRIESHQDNDVDQPDEHPSSSVPLQTPQAEISEKSQSRIQEEEEDRNERETRSKQYQQSQTEVASSEISEEWESEKESESQTEQFQEIEREAPLLGSRLQEEVDESETEQDQPSEAALPKASLQDETTTENGNEQYPSSSAETISLEISIQEETYDESRIEQYQQQPTEEVRTEATPYEENDSESGDERHQQDHTNTVHAEESLQEGNGRTSDGEDERDTNLPEASSEEESDSASRTGQYQHNHTEAFIPKAFSLDHGTIVEPQEPVGYQEQPTTLRLSEAEQFDDDENIQDTAAAATLVSLQPQLNQRPVAPPPRVREIFECVEIPMVSRSQSLSISKRQNKGTAHDHANAIAVSKPKRREFKPVFSGYESREEYSELSSRSGSLSPWENESSNQLDGSRGTHEGSQAHGYDALPHLLPTSTMSSRERPVTPSIGLQLPLASPAKQLTLNENGTMEMTHLDRLKAIWSKRSGASSLQSQENDVGSIPLTYSPDFVFGTAMPLPNKR